MAPLTTLEVGGEAAFFLDTHDVSELREALAWSRASNLETVVLGGGSNVLVADEGLEGLVLRYRPEGWRDVASDADSVTVEIAAGTPWDTVVAGTVEAGLAGIECLSGIPGWAGAAPVQNIGAYGQALDETLVYVDVVDRVDGSLKRYAAADCGMGYRTSHFKEAWRERYVITALAVRLRKADHATCSYRDIQRLLGLAAGQRIPLAALRSAVLSVRRQKSMVYDIDDPNHRSAGSFFTNPVVGKVHAERIASAVRERGILDPMPMYPARGERLKLSAAWLIEQAGFRRGHTQDAVGLSSQHALAVINRGGARAAEIVQLARQVVQKVDEVFGVRLQPEPVWLGFSASVNTLLYGA